ncbi:hypothetical protein BH23BAC3_BH23BAC3_09570 [soil metagenome]
MIDFYKNYISAFYNIIAGEEIIGQFDGQDRNREFSFRIWCQIRHIRFSLASYRQKQQEKLS